MWRVIAIFGSRSAFGFIATVISAAIGLAVSAALLYYLYRPAVKAAFGKGSEQPPSFLTPVFVQIDTIVANNARSQGPRPQGPGGYQPPQAPGGYPPPPPQGGPGVPAHYEPPQPPEAPQPPAQ